ncbi:leucyl/phenylalanyl-tRNA--protein transferase [Leptothrix discophora]|uniref:Leucyl/phenylalanyl-tRNA--protein transferase n=1 Tax=Leptothrix discophora TaxID=89 RepID=A0ABT9FZ08_LEPDI|nr:leucyl/phenylalanyl-tRNA--protein transferase [Leptothrix discophora]MDP4299473.1 leucyl/phenylalanyl-tRNA--protein transferase [Leptothrix discophora]
MIWPFPPTSAALGPDSDAPGLLCAGGRLGVARLTLAYRQGIFPWYSAGQPVLWWTTDPRMVLQVANFRLHRSLRKALQRFLVTPGCEIRVDSAFERVMRHCSATPREGQQGTWIVDEVIDAYVRMHRAGRAHSFETWVDGELVGGLYGVNIGRMFYGESMFAHRTDASKFALAALVAFCRAHGIDWIDCQQETAHLASMGASPLPRARFERHLSAVVDLPAPESWSYDPANWSRLDLRTSPAGFITSTNDTA